ncbi:hypothetical protein BDV12DRAFT_176835 [Aspergillus spectabilis]
MTTRISKKPRSDWLDGNSSVAHFPQRGERDELETEGKLSPDFESVSPHFRLLTRGSSAHWLWPQTRPLPV